MNTLPLFERIDAQLKIYNDLKQLTKTINFILQAKELHIAFQLLAEELVRNVNRRLHDGTLYFMSEMVLDDKSKDTRFIVALMTIRPTYSITELEYNYATKILDVLDPGGLVRNSISKEVKQMIDMERPLKAVNKVDNKNCSSCGLANADKTCGKCHKARYCDEKCQSTHWATHKSTCTSKTK